MLVAGGDPASLARDAVEQELRQGSPTPQAVRLRRVEVFRQSLPGVVAVCGQVSPNGAEAAFTDFVAVAGTEEGGVRVQELHLADTPGGASRTRAESWLRCTDETRRLDVAAPPPPSPPAARPVQGEAGAVPTGLTVTMRQGGNLRSAPDANSPVIRTLPRGTVARVFGQPRGNWYQIGDTAPWGWMHLSMLEGPPR